MIAWRDLAASSVTNKTMKGLQRKSITLDELVNEVMPLLSPYAPTTIEAQIPVFTEWVANALSESTILQKKNCSNWYYRKFVRVPKDRSQALQP